MLRLGVGALVAIGCGPAGPFGHPGAGGASDGDADADSYTDDDWPPEEIFTAGSPPPPLSGGTLAISRDGHRAFGADTDRDVVWVVDLDGTDLLATIALEPGDEPGRLVEDAAGRVHVALRGAGALATIDVEAGDVVRRSVCSEPRGVAYDDADDVVHVACVGGELVTFPAGGGAATRTLHLDTDLRDVVVDGAMLWVSRFRSAEVLSIDPAGRVSARVRPPDYDPAVEGHIEGDYSGYYAGQDVFAAAVAWRMIPRPGGGVILVHQRARTTPLSGLYYGDDCTGGLVHTTVTEIDPGAEVSAARIVSSAPLPVDVAATADGSTVAIASAATDAIVRRSPNASGIICRGGCIEDAGDLYEPEAGWPIGVAFTPSGRLVVQTREPATIGFSDGPRLALPAESMRDTGWEMFHGVAGFSTMACASCHPEGREDGRVWDFPDIGPRRTQSIGGGILATAPYHWDGSLPTLWELMEEVFVGRMGAQPPSPARTRAILAWLDTIPALAASPARDPDAAARGEALFRSAGVFCVDCHEGDWLTTSESKDVGTGGKFQVPSLVGVWARDPFLHDGRAPTLRDRFGPGAGGDRHGVTSHLSEDEIGNLVAYLETL